MVRTIGDAPARAGRVYALSSGMMTPKTLSNIFARRVIEDPRHSIFFVGYADPVSPAGFTRNERDRRLNSTLTSRSTSAVPHATSVQCTRRVSH
jgi:hypothetical protein